MKTLKARQQVGLTLIESLVAISILVIFLAIAVPGLQNFVRNSQVRSASESLLNGFRLAQAEAIKRNQLVELTFTATLTNPVAATRDATQPHWIIRTLPNNYLDPPPVTGAQLLQARSNLESSPNTTVEGKAKGTTNLVASIVYNGLGRTERYFKDNGAPLVATDDLIYRFTSSGGRTMCVFVSPAGAAKLCDPSKPSGDPRACQPFLTLSDCAI